MTKVQMIQMNERVKRIQALAASHGGKYDRDASSGVSLAFQFASPHDRINFVAEMSRTGLSAETVRTDYDYAIVAIAQ